MGPGHLRLSAHAGARRGCPVVREATVRAPAGKWTAFVGATGAGKSTLLALALRYWDPQSGCMRMDGTDIRGYRVEALRRRIAVVDQRPHLFTGTIASNLRLVAPAASDDELWAALDAAQLGEDVRRMGGLEARVGERAATLSGGQAQRLALARAFLVDAHLVVLDEFTSHLDPELADRVRASVREIFPDATILEVTHTAPADALSQRDAGIDRLVVVGEGGIDEAASLST
ncbi:ABC transporter ATP-binding protein [Nanchangia anserum]|uniref:ATP-binding cassette domain-containing protein n=1 Tax=Nanchangia anserum TaxID=2692125 RepID=UPI001883EFFF|nr:ABC transporter ATP-binding protein [Nanchangia anserum]QOX81465.1 ABC transporter ATP-binding protein [Nanchangia anserum]